MYNEDEIIDSEEDDGDEVVAGVDTRGGSLHLVFCNGLGTIY